MGKKRAHLIVRGRVQGVFFRAHTEEAAQSFKLNGWVKNREDGAVEIVAEGGEEEIKQFVEWCHTGPPSAHVSNVDVRYSGASGEFSSFRIKYF